VAERGDSEASVGVSPYSGLAIVCSLRGPAIPRIYSRTQAPKLTRCHFIRHLRDTTRDTEIESETGTIAQLDFCLRTGEKRANERRLRSGDWHSHTPAERTAQPKSRRASQKSEASRCSQRCSRGPISKRQGMDTTRAVRPALLASKDDCEKRTSKSSPSLAVALNCRI
jgi:hypothetical protein